MTPMELAHAQRKRDELAAEHSERMAAADAMRAELVDLHAVFDLPPDDRPGMNAPLTLERAWGPRWAAVAAPDLEVLPPPPSLELPEAWPSPPNDPPPLPVEAEAQAAADLQHAPEVTKDEAAGLAVVARGKLGNRTLDWGSLHDPRSLDYALRDRLVRQVAVQDTHWPHGPILDQGPDGACVGFAVADAANALQLMPDTGLRLSKLGTLDAEDATDLYRMAQDLDEVSGRDYVGTSVLAGMKAGVAAGLWEGYGWAFGTRDIAQAILQGLGPVVIGVPWLSGMTAGADGVVRLTGAAGLGHCLIATNLRLSLAGRPGPWFQLQQSWGVDEGVGGMVYLHHRDLALLLAGQGEAAVPLSERWEPKA